MKKILLMLLSLVASVGSAWAQSHYDRIELTFANLTTNGADVIVTDGSNPIPGVTATYLGAVSDGETKTLITGNNAGAENIVCPTYANAQGKGYTMTFKIEGLSGFAYNNASIDAWGLNSGGGYQISTGRNWNITLLAGTETSALTALGTENHDLCPTSNQAPHNEFTYETNSTTVNGDYYLEITTVKTVGFGCFCGIKSITLYKAGLSDVKNSAKTTVSNYALASESIISNAINTIEAATTEAEVESAVAAAHAAYAAELDGKYYHIKNGFANYYTQQNVYKCLIAGANKITWGTFVENTPTNFFRITPAEGDKLYLYTPEGLYVQGVQGALAAEPGENSAFGLVKYEDNTYNLNFGDGTMHTEGHSNGAGISGNLVSWAGVGGTASSWYIEETTPQAYEAAVLAALPGVLQDLRQQAFHLLASEGTSYGEITITAGKQALNDAWEAAFMIDSDATVQELKDAIAALQAALAGFEYTINLPQDGTFIRMKSCAFNNYISIPANHQRGTSLIMSDEANAENIFCYTEGKLLSYASGMYINGNNHAHLGYSSAVAFELSQNGTPATCSIKPSGNYWYAVESGNINNYAGGAHDNCDWIIEDVTLFPVNITEAGYATFYTPVAMEVPAEVTAYTAAVNGERLNLTEVENGIIPANTGVILAAEPDTYYLTLATEEVTLASELAGTVATRIKPEGNIYTLQMQEEVIGFYPYEGGELHGFRAYLTLEEGANIKGLTFDQTTAIQQAIAAQQGSKVYDLQGRRIQTIQNGISIQGGKKIIK